MSDHNIAGGAPSAQVPEHGPFLTALLARLADVERLDARRFEAVCPIRWGEPIAAGERVREPRRHRLGIVKLFMDSFIAVQCPICLQIDGARSLGFAIGTLTGCNVIPRE